MLFDKTHRIQTLSALLLLGFLAASCMFISTIPRIVQIGISPLVIAMIIGLFFGATLRHRLPPTWTPGIRFVAKRILRLAIVLYGFRLTFQEVAMVGMEGVLFDIIVVSVTLIFGTLIGTQWFKLDKETALLMSSGAAICGAAAVLATEGVLKSEPNKAILAVISVVFFGTVGMFLYPFMQQAGWLGLTDTQYAVFAGGTIYEVAQVVVAGSQISPTVGQIAVTVKMVRVMLLVPALFVIGLLFSQHSTGGKHRMLVNIIPWFAVGFILMVGINSLHMLPSGMVAGINQFDTLLLTMAMMALGMETNLNQIRKVGLRPLYFGLTIFLSLMLGGYLLSHYLL